MSRVTVLAAVGALALAASVAAPMPARAESAAVSATCNTLYTTSTAVLGTAATVGPASVGYPGQASAQGCQIAFSGDGTQYGTSFQAVADKLDAMMLGAGWTRDHSADADGPTGTATGYRKGGELVAVSVGYDTPAGVCRKDEPSASCHPTAAQMLYTITLGVMAGS